MSSITQTIGSYTGGISQQPDELKLPGQVSDALNVLPDVTQGLLKRPGGKFVASLSDNGTAALNSNTNGKWFHYYRDEAEQYIGQINRSGDINMWRCSDGYAMTVTNNLPTSSVTGTYSRNTSGVITVTKSSHGFAIGEAVNLDFTSGTAVDGVYRITSVTDANTFIVGDATTASTSGNVTITQQYLMHTTDEDIQSLTLNDYTYITNRTKPAAMDAASATTAQPHEAFIELKKISYASHYALNVYDNTSVETVYTATRISVEMEYSSANACNSSGALPSGYPTGGDRCDDSAGGEGQYSDAMCPNVKTLIMKIDHGSRPGACSTNDANGQNWTISVTNSGGNASDRKNLYMRLATTGSPTAKGGSGDPVYHCRYTTTYDLLYGGEGWRTGDWFDIWMGRARYKVTILEHSESQVQANLGLIRPDPTPFDNETTVTAESILGDLRTTIMADTFGGTAGATVEQVGNGLYIKRTSGTFNITCPVPTLLNVFTKQVNDVAELPTQCKHGYRVKVANSVADEDDYYVQFFGNNDRDGEGVWEECPAPGRTVGFDTATMPIQMVRTSATEFTVNQIAWEDCPVGDTTTAPEPSFIGQTINKLLFFRNRMILLSDENVIMSRPGDFYNMWPKSAVTFTATDNVDISCSSEYPAVVYDGIQVNTGLILFTKNQQFMLTTDSDVLSPNTAKINALATYNFNYTTNPISLGTTIGFLDNAGKNTRFFEMADVAREGQPDVLEQTKIVSQLFPKDIGLIANSRENSVIFFAEKNKNEIYGYRYFASIEKRLQNAWFRWKVSGDVQHLAMLDDALYAVIRNNGKDVLQKFSIKLEDSGNYLINDLGTTSTDDDLEYRIYLDNATTVAHTDLTYEPNGNYTHFELPTGFNNNDGELAVVYNPTGTDKTFLGMVEKVYTYDNQNDNPKVKLSGNWKSYDPQGIIDASTTDDVSPTGNVIVGYLYDMEVKFPTVYYQKPIGDKYRSEIQGSLIVHRLKFSFGPLGVYETILERVGKPNYTELYESLIADNYISNRVQFTQGTQKTIPVYERNTNVSIVLKSKHPSPATLYSMTWEGDYTNKFYQRV